MHPAPHISDSALTVLHARYFRRDEWGQPREDFQGMLHRVATAVAEPCRCFGEDSSLWAERFLRRMVRLEFLPNSSHVDAAVSKTVYLPAAAPRGVVRHVSQTHRLGLKGITAYRYGSRPNQTLSLVHDEAHACRDCAV